MFRIRVGLGLRRLTMYRGDLGPLLEHQLRTRSG